MHTVYTPGTVPGNYNFEEPCPHCDSYVPVLIDEQEHTCYEVTCPVCGQKLMLCTLCHWDDEESDDPKGCDWSPCNGCCRKLPIIKPKLKEYEVFVNLYASFVDTVKATSQEEANNIVREKFANMTKEYESVVRSNADLFETMIEEE